MSKEAGPGRFGLPAPYPPKDHWEYGLYEYHKGLPDQSHYEFMANTPGIKTAEYWKDWCQAIFYSGTTLYLWNEVPELKAAFLSACSVKAGHRVLLVGKYTDETCLAPALRSLVGATGDLAVEEIGGRVIQAFATGSPSSGTQLQWEFDYLDPLPDEGLDRVILFGAASHVANWKGFAASVDRVLCNGGRLVIAEIPLGGEEFVEATHEDAHWESFILRVLTGLGLTEDELPHVGPKELRALFEPYLGWSRSYSHEGIYLFYGQKGAPGHGEVSAAVTSPGLTAHGAPGVAAPAGASQTTPIPACPEPVEVFPETTAEIRAFLEVKPTKSTYDLLSTDEKRVWGAIVEDIQTPHMGKFVVWGGGSLCWNYRNQREITDIMWGNLAVAPGDKVMMIAEFPEDLGNLEELQKRVGPEGEIVNVTITSSPRSYDYKGWQAKRRMYMEQGSPEEWPYDFADDYPDGYFDCIFLPQGVHHCNNWPRDAKRLLRAIRPGGQIMAIECGINRPQMTTARRLSALARVVGDRCFELALPHWLVGPLSPEGPLPPGTGYEHVGRPYHDVPVDHLRESFGDDVRDPCSLEYKGWILYWGFKKSAAIV
jgi:SAM-dependent methyltransferase